MTCCLLVWMQGNPSHKSVLTWFLNHNKQYLFFYTTVPVAAPENVRVLVQNSTLAEVHWDPVSPELVRGRLQGYRVCVSYISDINWLFIVFIVLIRYTYSMCSYKLWQLIRKNAAYSTWSDLSGFFLYSSSFHRHHKDVMCTLLIFHILFGLSHYVESLVWCCVFETCWYS